MPFSKDITKCSGYNLSGVKTTKHGLTGSLKLAGNAAYAYGRDIEDLVLLVEAQDDHRLHVHIFDKDEKQYQIPPEVLAPPPKSSSASFVSSDLVFNYESSPFAFWITRSTSGETVFDTRSRNIPVYEDAIKIPKPDEKETRVAKEALDSKVGPDNDLPFLDADGKDSRTRMPAHPLIFEDQYLQLSTALPSPANIYGLGEVISSSGLRRNDEFTIATMWNRDSGGSPTDQTLYGSHPFYLDVRPTPRGISAHGVAMRSSHGMDVLMRPGVLEYRLLGGTLDLYFFSGPTPMDVIRQYSAFTGKPTQMPYWAFGFHMLRWDGGFNTVDGVRDVVEKMRKEDIPYETIWSDLDHMDARKDWTCDPERFEPAKFKKFVEWLHSNHQHFIPLVDVAVGMKGEDGAKYLPYEGGHAEGLFMHNADGSELVGKVWPGETVFPDWTHPETTQWWIKQNDDFHKKVPYDGIWLDMNEPASFKYAPPGGPVFEGDAAEHTDVMDEESKSLDIPPYAIHDGWKGLERMSILPSSKNHDGSRHYNMHNTYGYREVKATHECLKRQHEGERPFILSRSSFPGLGQIAAKWLGDNYSTWQSMRDSIQGVLQFQMFQIPMVGPDTCGFGNDPTPGYIDPELCNRWMQLSAFFPFYRNHNADQSPDQYPYCWDDVAAASRKVINARYTLLPYWEGLFRQAHQDGTPPLRPLFFEFPREDLLPSDEQFLVGPSLLVTPVVHKGATSVKGVFPTENGTQWRSWWTHELVTPDGEGKAEIQAPLGEIPVHIRSGSVLLVYNEPRYTTKETREGSMGLVIHLNGEGEAEGVFHLDDGMSLGGPSKTVEVRVSQGRIAVLSSGSYSVPSVNALTSVKVLNLERRPLTIRSIGCVGVKRGLEEGERCRVTQWEGKTGTAWVGGLNLDLNEGGDVSWA